jgi:phosphinothricin acetyltransferase
MEIRALDESDWPAVSAIYADGIATGNATFESDVPTWEAWNAAHPTVRLVAEEDGAVVGWAALSPYSGRRCYRGVAEESVYVAEPARGSGVGRKLLSALIERAEADGYWTLHAALGFHVVGRHEGLGERDGVWRDVVLLEYRSTTSR